MAERTAVVLGREPALAPGEGRAVYHARLHSRGATRGPALHGATLGAVRGVEAGLSLDHLADLDDVDLDVELATSLVGDLMVRESAPPQALRALMAALADRLEPRYRLASLPYRLEELLGSQERLAMPLNAMVEGAAAWCCDLENQSSPLMAPMTLLLMGRLEEARQLLTSDTPDFWLRDVVHFQLHRREVGRATDVLWRGGAVAPEVLDHLQSEPVLDAREVLRVLLPLYDIFDFQPETPRRLFARCSREQATQAEVLRPGLIALLAQRLNDLAPLEIPGLNLTPSAIKQLSEVSRTNDPVSLAQERENFRRLLDALDAASDQLDPWFRQADHQWWGVAA